MSKRAAKKQKQPLEYLLEVINDETADDRLRVQAASTAAQYLHTRTKDGGKKEATQGAAEAVATGKYAPTTVPPRLVVNNR